MGFSEFKLDPTKQNKTTSLIYIYIYIYYCKEKKEKEESKLPDHLELASCRVVTVGIVRFRGDNWHVAAVWKKGQEKGGWGRKDQRGNHKSPPRCMWVGWLPESWVQEPGCSFLCRLSTILLFTVFAANTFFLLHPPFQQKHLCLVHTYGPTTAFFPPAIPNRLVGQQLCLSVSSICSNLQSSTPFCAYWKLSILTKKLALSSFINLN